MFVKKCPRQNDLSSLDLKKIYKGKRPKSVWHVLLFSPKSEKKYDSVSYRNINTINNGRAVQ
jgi:hypothetical protein